MSEQPDNNAEVMKVKTAAEIDEQWREILPTAIQFTSLAFQVAVARGAKEPSAADYDTAVDHISYARVRLGMYIEADPREFTAEARAKREGMRKAKEDADWLKTLKDFAGSDQIALSTDEPWTMPLERFLAIVCNEKNADRRWKSWLRFVRESTFARARGMKEDGDFSSYGVGNENLFWGLAKEFAPYVTRFRQLYP